MITQEKNRLIVDDGFGTLWIEPWGADSVRVRMTKDRCMDKNDWALDENCAAVVENRDCKIEIKDVDTTYPWAKHFEKEMAEGTVQLEKTSGQEGALQNGRMKVLVNHEGWLSFWDGKKLLFEEQWRNRWRIDRFCVPTNTAGRELKAAGGSGGGAGGSGAGGFGCKATVRFEAYDDEKLYGMGQYQDSHLDKKGGVWELAQKNSQASVPFVVSSRGYGFLWNNPAVGTATFGTNGTVWVAEQTQKIDYWVTCGTPAEVEEKYTAVTGRTPMMPDFAMGFWQCKLRYRNQVEVISVAKEYKRRGLPLDVIVIDFFHWSCQGDFKFDAEDWPDPDAMVKELSELGVKLMVSVWPTVDERSENFKEMASNGLLISFDRKDGFNMDWMGNTVFFDTTNPECRRYIWEKCKENYFKKGIQLFWLDEAEPEYGIYEFEHYKYHIGPAMECSNIYPYFYAKAWYDGLKEEGVELPLSLVRCAWAGSQKFGAVVWSGDVHSDFRSFRNQVQAGLSMAMAGIPWWTTDIGGFLGGDVRDEGFHELLIRWFEWGCFCPVMRLHGERPPFFVPEKPYHEVRGEQIKQMESGQDNEIWSFGDEVYPVLKGLLELRERLRPYIKKQMMAAHESGTPVMRPLLYDFPDDVFAWNIEDEYMFGPDLLVCPVMSAGKRKRYVYLPEADGDVADGGAAGDCDKSGDGKKLVWIDAATGVSYEGGQLIEVEAPLERIPVFTRGSFEIKIWK